MAGSGVPAAYPRMADHAEFIIGGAHQDKSKASRRCDHARSLRIAAARKPDGIDFVGNSKISSFPQNLPPTSARWYFYTLRTGKMRNLVCALAALIAGAMP